MFKIVRKEETASSALARLSVSVASSKNNQFRIGLMKLQWEFPIGKGKSSQRNGATTGDEQNKLKRNELDTLEKENFEEGHRSVHGYVDKAPNAFRTLTEPTTLSQLRDRDTTMR